jgi:hypothetical protein
MKTGENNPKVRRSFEPTPGHKWQMGDEIPGEWHKLLGPCPDCGAATFDYGGGWRCLALYCRNNVDNPAPNVGPRPEWWDENINVFMDGNAWCATYDDFQNLQESIAGFGDTPSEAVKELKKELAELNKTSTTN